MNVKLGQPEQPNSTLFNVDLNGGTSNTWTAGQAKFVSTRIDACGCRDSPRSLRRNRCEPVVSHASADLVVNARMTAVL